MRYALLLALVFSASSSMAATLPTVKNGTDYGDARKSLLSAGWRPVHVSGADKCMEGDARCQGRPEMEACAGGGAGNCRFIWGKSGKKVVVFTIGDPAEVSGASAYH